MPRQIIHLLSRLRQISNDRSDRFAPSHIVTVNPPYTDIQSTSDEAILLAIAAPVRTQPTGGNPLPILPDALCDVNVCAMIA